MSYYYITPIKSINEWPSGVDGALVILNTETVQLPAGSLKDYSSIQIDAGGKLEILAGSAWTILGCKGACTINGDVKLVKGEHTGGTFNDTAPDDFSLSYTINQQNGGAGGNDIENTGASGGSQNSGNGGGGAGSGNGGNATASKGGDGNIGSSPTTGVGANIYATNGGNGPNGNYFNAYTAGGGGGSRGRHGQGLYLKISGIYSGSGTIDASGEAGGAGGDGGDNNGGGSSVGSGCGGGGAAGGSGGKIVIRYGSSTFAGSHIVTGGAGGIQGAGGTDNNGSNQSGNAGTAGQAGSTDIAAY